MAGLSRGAYTGGGRRRVVQAFCYRRSIRSKRAEFGCPPKNPSPRARTAAVPTTRRLTSQSLNRDDEANGGSGALLGVDFGGAR